MTTTVLQTKAAVYPEATERTIDLDTQDSIRQIQDQVFQVCTKSFLLAAVYNHNRDRQGIIHVHCFQSLRPHPKSPITRAGTKSDQESQSDSMPASTYHCLCSTLILRLPEPLTLEILLRRKGQDLDDTAMLSLPAPTIDEGSASGVGIINSALEKNGLIIERTDGYEKRLLWKCERCELVWGYEVDSGDGEEVGRGKVLYLLVDGLRSTDDLERLNGT